MGSQHTLTGKDRWAEDLALEAIPVRYIRTGSLWKDYNNHNSWTRSTLICIGEFRGAGTVTVEGPSSMVFAAEDAVGLTVTVA